MSSWHFSNSTNKKLIAYCHTIWTRKWFALVTQFSRCSCFSWFLWPVTAPFRRLSCSLNLDLISSICWYSSFLASFSVLELLPLQPQWQRLWNSSSCRVRERNRKSVRGRSSGNFQGFSGILGMDYLSTLRGLLSFGTWSCILVTRVWNQNVLCGNRLFRIDFLFPVQSVLFNSFWSREH